MSIFLSGFFSFQFSIAVVTLTHTFLPMDYAALTYADHPPVLLSIDESYSPSWDLSIATLKGGFLSRADQYFLELVRQTFAQEPNDK